MRARSILLAVCGVAVVALAIVLWPSRSTRVSETGSSPAPLAGEASARPQPFATDAERRSEGASPAASPAAATQATGESTASTAITPRVPLPDDPTAVLEQRPANAVCRMAPVLPAVPDIMADSCSTPVNVAEILSKEDRDLAWATDMEARIRTAISGVEGLALARVEVECRMTSCGIVLVHAEDADSRQEQSLVTLAVRDAMGFRQWGGSAGATADGKAFSTVSLMRATGREHLWPAPPAIAALPGVAGVDVPLLGVAAIDDANPAKLLAEEADDPDWARPMESRITGEVALLAPKNFYQSYVGCRRTVCGVVLLYPPGSEVDVRKVEDAFAEALGFRPGGGRRYERETGTMVTIYLHR